MIFITIYLVTTVVVLLLGLLVKLKFKFNALNMTYSIHGINIYLIVTFVIMTSIMALRSPEVGVDTAPYTRIFNTIANSNTFIEAIKTAPLTAPIYVLICYVLSIFSKDSQIMIVFSSFFVNIGLWHFIKKESVNPVLSIFCWIGLSLFYCSMNGNRQCMALVLVINALIYLTENIKSIKGWIMILLAAGIHSTSLFIIIAIFGIVFSEKVKNPMLIFYGSFAISFCVSIVYSPLIKMFIHFFPRYAMYLSGESSYSILEGTGGGRVVIIYLFLLSLCFLWFFAYKKNKIELDKFHKKMFPALIFGAVFGIFNCRNELINRMLWFYISLYITFIPYILKKYYKIGHIFTVATIGALFVYSFLTLIENQNGVVPYSFFW